MRPWSSLIFVAFIVVAAPAFAEPVKFRCTIDDNRATNYGALEVMADSDTRWVLIEAEGKGGTGWAFRDGVTAPLLVLPVGPGAALSDEASKPVRQEVTFADDDVSLIWRDDSGGAAHEIRFNRSALTGAPCRFRTR